MSSKENQEVVIIKEFNDYLKFLYEEEDRRTDRLNSSMSTYQIFITFALTFNIGLVKWMYPDSFNTLFGFGNLIQFIFSISFILAFFLILLSLIFTFLVIKVRVFERLCEPVDFSKEVISMEEVGDFFSSIASHYVVAIERNSHINDLKAQWLSKALRVYIVGFIIMVFSIFLTFLI